LRAFAIDGYSVVMHGPVLRALSEAYHGAEGGRERPTSPSDFKFETLVRQPSARTGASPNTIRRQENCPLVAWNK
jgi:hypothetical protein